jgi:hypothetical protein
MNTTNCILGPRMFNDIASTAEHSVEYDKKTLLFWYSETFQSHEHYYYGPARYSRLCGLMVRVPGCRSRVHGFDSRPYQIFWEVVGLERGQLNLVSVTKDIWLYVYIRILYILMYIKIKMCVCSSITVERLEEFQLNLVHTWLYKYIKILFYILYIWKWMYVCLSDRRLG